jgi:hypothetical protein
LNNGACIESEANKGQDGIHSDRLDEEEDPMLMKMPTVDFKAYRRADISSFYQEHAGSREEKVPRFRGQAGKFVNMSPDQLDLYW